MNATALIQLALGFMRFVSWLTTQISQKQWKDSGYQQAMLEVMKEVSDHVAAAEQASEDAKKLTPEERRKRLKEV